MFLYNYLTIRNIQLGRCGTKSSSHLKILHDHGYLLQMKYSEVINHL